MGTTGVAKIKRKISKPGPPIILENLVTLSGLFGLITGSRFDAKMIDFTSRNGVWVWEGS